MTRLLLLLGAVLLLPLAGEAGEFDLAGQPRITLGCIDGFIDDPIIHQCVPYPDPCLATMEAAMRAMEPFLTSSLRSTPEAERDQYQQDKYRAFKQWNDAKQCWKNQP